MEKKRWLYVVAGVFFAIFGVVGLFDRDLPTMIREYIGGQNPSIWEYVDWTGWVDMCVCLVLAILLIVKAFVPKMHHAFLVIPFAVFAVTRMYASVWDIVVAVQELVKAPQVFENGFNWSGVFDVILRLLAIVANLSFIFFRLATLASIIFYISLKDRLRVLFFLPSVFYLVDIGVSFFFTSLESILYSIYKSDWLYMVTPVVVATEFSLGMVAYFLICFALFMDTKPKEKKPKVKRTRKRKKKSKGLEGYISMPLQILLQIVTFGLWEFVWIYKTTDLLGLIDEEDDRDPVFQLLLCALVPFYNVYWTYKTAKMIDKQLARKSIDSELTVVCTVFALGARIVCPILMQERLNALVKASLYPKSKIAREKAKRMENAMAFAEEVVGGSSGDIVVEIERYKNLYDNDAITVEEYEAVKKVLLKKMLGETEQKSAITDQP